MYFLLAMLACKGTDPAETGGCAACKGDDSGLDETGETGETGDTADTGETGETGDTAASGPAPRVILFVGDGMGFPHVAGGGMYAYGAAGALEMEALPYAGRLLTASLSGVTDSAAGATALATGQKTWNYTVAMDRDGAPLTTILEVARARGLATGVVTTDTLTGATPASFVAHTPSRGDRSGIAEQLAATPPDVVLGGGRNDLEGPFAGLDVQWVTTRDALAAAVPDERPLVGVFAAYTFPYVVDGYLEEPPLSEMVAKALDVLEDDPDGFFLVVEGARIDHASHGNDGDRVHQETAAFDEAVATAIRWADDGGFDPTLLVTADHECGGLEVSGGGEAGTVPDSAWRWGDHTNADVPVFGRGPFAETIDGQRLDNTWVHAVLEAAVTGADAVTAPAESVLVDGRTTDLGAPVATQRWETSFGAGYNQLDALRISADEEGLRVGVDGVFEVGENAVFVLLDVDYGAGTGWGADDTVLADTFGTMDTILTALPYTSGVPGLGFELAFGSIGAEELGLGDLSEVAGVRGFPGAWGDPDDFWWLPGLSNFDDGNLADGGVAVDAAATGTTANGWEVLVPWWSVYPDGLPAEGLTIGVVAVLASGEGSWASNQALPPLWSDVEPGASVVLLESAAVVEVDGSGVARGPATVVP